MLHYGDQTLGTDDSSPLDVKTLAVGTSLAEYRSRSYAVIETKLEDAGSREIYGSGILKYTQTILLNFRATVSRHLTAMTVCHIEGDYR